METTKLFNFISMFRGATSFNGDISAWFSREQKTIVATSMFEDAVSFNQDLSCWRVSGNSRINAMFKGATKFKSNLNDWTYASNQATNAFLGSNMSVKCKPGQTGCELPRCTKMTDACLFWHRTQSCRDGGDCSYVQELDISFMGDQGFWCLKMFFLGGLFVGETAVFLEGPSTGSTRPST